mmetsp:Transcript_31883/g.105572  ORF Transcript_31883/g.105572 Transcript_31883/m.105572 type:complete len:249 (+) Transcript_31883:796-1542(+)
MYTYSACVSRGCSDKIDTRTQSHRGEGGALRCASPPRVSVPRVSWTGQLDESVPRLAWPPLWRGREGDGGASVAGEGEAVPAEAVERTLVVPVVRHAPRVPRPAVSQAQVRALGDELVDRRVVRLPRGDHQGGEAALALRVQLHALHLQQLVDQTRLLALDCEHQGREAEPVRPVHLARQVCTGRRERSLELLRCCVPDAHRRDDRRVLWGGGVADAVCIPPLGRVERRAVLVRGVALFPHRERGELA